MTTAAGSEVARRQDEPVSSEVETVRNEDESRYEGRMDDTVVTVLDFVRDGSVLGLTHTGTDPDHRGRGLAGAVTRAALTDIRRRGERVVPHCPFAADFLDAHPEFADLRA